MKMVSFSMYGYKRLLPGLGKDNIRIDFKNNNTICIINGPNGIGKSTILNAMTPLPDTNDNFVEGKDAGKVFIYDNGYSIAIQNNVKNGVRQTSKAFISKNGIELNPTGNISSYKDLLYSEFGLDPCYISLTSLSNDDKGIAMKTPSVRKKFFNGLLSNMEVYNNINKTMVKRSNIFKSMINNITTKISSIGDESKLSSLLSGIENELNVLEVNKNNLIKSIAEDEAKIKSLDPSAEIQTTYDKKNNNISQLKIEFDRITAILNNNTNYKSYSNLSYEELSNTLNSLKVSYERNSNLEKEISNEVTKLLDTQQEELQFHQTKIARLNSLKADIDFDKLEAELQLLKSTIYNLEKILKDNNVDNLKSSDLYYLSDKLFMVKEQIELLKEEDFYNEYIEEEYNDINIFRQKTQVYEENISRLEIFIKELQDKFANSQKFNILVNLKNLIPKDCTNTNYCLLCKEIYNAEKNIDENLIEEIKDTENLKQEEMKNLEKYKAFIKIEMQIQKIQDTFNEVYERYNGAGKGVNLKLCLNSYFLIKEINNIRELGNYKNKLEGLTIEYSKKSSDYNLYKNKLDLIREVEEDIRILDSRLDNIAGNIENNTKRLEKIRNDIYTTQKEINELENILSKLKVKEDLNDRLSLEMRELSVLEHSMSDINVYLKNIENNNSKLSEIYDIIKSKTEDKERIKYSLSMLKEYNTELAIYKEKYDMIETIKYYSSPTTGIQTLFMKLYMNNTLNICNDILGKMFGGELTLDEYVINENEFRIPCINNNMRIDDISSMSSSQVSMISMIISMVLLKQSSSKFNIVRLDEIDAGLDTNNRIQFVNTCIELIKILELDQVIMISHNMMELNSINIDLIEIK